MKINKRSLSGKRIAVASAIVLVIAAGAIGAYVYFHDSPHPESQKPHIDLKPPTKEQIKAGSDIKKQLIENAVKPDSPGSASEQSTSSLETQLTTASVQGDMLYVRNNINGIYQDGTCTLTLTKDKSVLTYTAGIQALPQSSTCKGFNVSTNQMSSGTWAIKVTVVINGQTATATGNVDV